MVRPIVLLFGGLDPTGGAGLAADIEALAALGARGAPVASALTVQDTIGVSAIFPVAATLVLAQAEAVLADLPVVAIKVGLLPGVDLVEAVAKLVLRYPMLPLIVDPVLASGRGDRLTTEPTEAALRTLLLPLADLVTPNLREAQQLTGVQGRAAAASALLACGSRAVLLTGGDEHGVDVENHLYRPHAAPVRWSWPRLPHQYHGSGCTLAAASAALLARGMELEAAVAQAQSYTWQALAAADGPGRGQQLPNRLWQER